MDIDLFPVSERVEWAGRHIEQMKRLVQAYVDSRPIYVHLTKSPDGGFITEEVSLTAEPPIQLGLALGDVTHHLRAALDNLVGAIAVGGPTRTSAFPIADTEERFQQLARSMLRDVPSWAVDLVREVQPIPGSPREDIGQDLRSIDAVAQRDRHRALLLHAPIIHNVDTVTFPDPTQPGPVHLENVRGSNGAPWVRYPTGSLVRIEYRVGVEISEDVEGVEGQDIVRLSELWLGAARDVVNLFWRVLDSTWR